MRAVRKTQGGNPGFFYAFFGEVAYSSGSLPDLSRSSHLLMRLAITPAITEIKKVINNSMLCPPFRASIGGGNRMIISQENSGFGQFDQNFLL